MTNFKLHNEWRKIMRHAWSVRLLILAAFLTGLETILPYLGVIIPLPPGLAALFSFLVVFSALIARFVAQKKLSGDDDAEK
ncbi:hypothetical protein NKH72_22220 [Mesorhizobium sp. M0955]|uniref:DUF7940 domain-containing protein n=1 Tax=Mesorhizobium sp. M0955 TaxID=2957033 RepID=UPI003334C9A3